MRFVELFAGIGLFRLGLEQLGPHWSCVLANDFSKMKAHTYRSNFGGADFLESDIAQIGAQQMPCEIDLITASFPCQDMSLAGDRAGFAGNRSSTFHQFTRVVSELIDEGRAPQTVLLENVPGLLTSHRGADVRTLLLTLNELGYGVDLLMLDASTWLPQSRPRVFVVGRRGEGKALELLEHLPQHRARSRQVERVIKSNADLNWSFLNLPLLPQVRQYSLDDLIEVETEGWFEQPELARELSYVRNRSLTRLNTARAATTHDVQVRYLAGYRRMRDNRVCLELRDDGLAGCLRTPTGGSSRQLLVEVGPNHTRVRYMTPREYARLMGVPETFVFPTNTRDALYGFGDAVAVPVITWLGAALEAQAAPVREAAPALAPVA